MNLRLSPLLWLILVAGAAFYGLSQVRVVNDLTAFLPREEGPAQALLLETLRDGPASRLIIVALGGTSDTARLAAASRRLVERLGSDDRFQHVANSPASLPPAELERWFAYRYLLGATSPEAFTAAALRQALESRLGELGAPLPPLDKARLPADPQATFRRLLATWGEGKQPVLRHGVWFDPAGRQALLLLETRAGGFDLDAQEAARNAILAAMEGEVTVQLSGPGILAAASRDMIRSETQWLSALATLAMLLILFAAYRSVRLLVLSALPLLAAMAVAVTVTSLVFGTIHGITLAFGVTLLGVAIDYPLHLFSHLQVGEHPRLTLQGIWPTLRLGVASTAIGYLAMAASPFEGLTQLAVFMVGGLVGALLTVRWVLPALVPARPVVAGRGFAPGGSGRNLWLLPVLITLGLGYLVWTPRPLLEMELSALSPIPPAWRELDEQLRQAAGAPDVSRLLLLEGRSAEAVLQRSEALVGPLEQLRLDGVIAGYRLPSDYLPAVATQRARRAALPEPTALAAQLAAAQQGLPFRAGLFQPFVHDVAVSHELTPLTPAAVAGTTLGARLTAVLRPRQDGWLGLVPLYGVQNEAVLAQWAEQGGPSLRYINLRLAADEMVARFLRDAGVYLLAGAALILLLLAAGLRELSRVVRVVLPVLAALTLTVALLHGFGVRLSLFHLVALLLVMGLGLDYGLFFARRAAAEEYARIGHAVTVCAISTTGVFGILALSHIPVLHAVGSTVALGVVLSYGFAHLVRTN